MKDENRFSGLLGGEYDLLKNALYYYDDLQKAIAGVVKQETSDDGEYKILEIGIGTGITTAFVLDSLINLNNVEIFAVDNEEKMLSEAKQRFVGVNNINFIFSDIIKYLKGVDDNFFDGCFSGYVIHNFDFPNREELLKELGRTIKSGGFFVNGDKIVVDDKDLQSKHYEGEIKLYDNLDKIGRSDIKHEWIEHYGEDEKIRFTESEQLGLLEKNGFVNNKFIFRELMGAVVFGKKS